MTVTTLHRIRTAAGRIRASRVRLAAISGLVAFTVLAGTSASYAYFQVTQQASATATAGTLAVTSANFTSVAYTFRNDLLDTVGSVTVTNTSDSTDGIARTATVVVGATGDATALGAIRYILTVKGAAACAAVNTVANGTVTENTVGTVWSTSTTRTAALAPGASVTYCLESYVRTASALASGTGARTITPSVTASLGAESWTATTGPVSVTQSSQAIYPLATSLPTDFSYIRPAAVSGTNYCMDVSGLNGPIPTDGTHVISWPCKQATTANQIWKLVQNGTAYGFVANNTQTRRSQQYGTGAGALIEVFPTDTTVAAQDWYVQQISTGLYQFVNRSSGLCASATNLSGDVTLQPCTDAASTQRFVVSPYISANPGCTSRTASGASSFTLTWTTTNPGPFKVYVGGVLAQTVTTASVTLGPYTTAQNVVITDSSSTYSSAAGDTQLATAALTPAVGGVAAVCTTSNLVN